MRAIIFAAAFVGATAAHGHSWYEDSCCSGIDCREVADGTVEERAVGVHVKGFGILSYSDPRLRWSRDDQDHLCVSISDGKLLCVYRKPKGY